MCENPYKSPEAEGERDELLSGFDLFANVWLVLFPAIVIAIVVAAVNGYF